MQEGATGPKAGVEMSWSGVPGGPWARSRRQEGADERCGAPAPPPPVALAPCNAASGRRLWGGAQRKRRDGGRQIRTVRPEPRPARAPPPALPSGLWLLHVQLVPWGRQIPTTRPGAPGRAGWTTSDRSSAAQDTAGRQGRGPGGAEEGWGAARADASQTHVLPRWVPVLPCLSLPSYGMGAGGRVWRQRGQAEARSRVRGLPRPGFAVGGHLQAAPDPRCPWPWLRAPVLLTWGLGARASASACGGGGGPRPGRGHQASGGGLPYLQVLPPHVHRGKGQLHLLPARVLVPLVGNLDEDEEDARHDAPSHQHEDPCGPGPRVSAIGWWGWRPPGTRMQGTGWENRTHLPCSQR